MNTRFANLILILLLLSGCSRGKVSYYARGDLQTKHFQNLISKENRLQREYYEVKRNKSGQIVSVKHFSADRKLLEKSGYNYNKKNQLTRLHRIEYFDQGPPRISRQWTYKNGRLLKQDEKRFTRSRLMEKRLTIHYDIEQKPFLEETWGLGNKIESSTEYYYDFKHRLDKSRRNFFFSEGDLRDYWLTIYNDQVQIITEEHYLPDNSLLAFYRYSYHPSLDYRESEEILDETRNTFITRKFNEFGHLLLEEEKSRAFILIKRLEYDYNEKNKPLHIRQYNAEGKLIKTSKYKKLRTLDSYRTPHL